MRAAAVAEDRLPFPHPTIPGAMLVRLTQGRFAVIDAADAAAVAASTWTAAKATESDTLFYAIAKIGGRMVKLHRFLWRRWGLADVPRLDHRDGDSLNCRRDNIRPCTPTQNLANSKLYRTNTSGFKGVLRLPSGRWKAYSRFGGVYQNLGVFETKEEAASAYIAAAQALRGEFARAS